MGDAILTTVVLNSLKKSFPGCSIDFVLNDKICPLFEGHPSIDRLIPFTEEERHNFFRYIKKVYHIVHSTHYDLITQEEVWKRWSRFIEQHQIF